ncbi:DUF4367 domain-containing protein [Oscillospiraceae bacterium 38-13]
MTDRELDALMQRVLVDSIKLDWGEMPEPEPPFVPSARYRRQIRFMLANPLAWERRKTAPVWKKIARHAAVVLLIISIGFSSLLAVSPSVRAAFFQWIAEWYETHVTYRYTDQEAVKIMPQYEITELPEGYAEVESERVEWLDQVDIIYRQEESGKKIYLNYVQIRQGAVSDFETIGNSKIVPVTVNGQDGLFFETEDLDSEWNTVTWIDPDADLQFSIDAYLDKTDILHIAESVSLVKVIN